MACMSMDIIMYVNVLFYESGLCNVELLWDESKGNWWSHGWEGGMTFFGRSECS